jgi:hypothetical protein
MWCNCKANVTRYYKLMFCRSLFFLEKPSRVRLSKQKIIPRCPDEESAVIMEEYIREIL